MMLNLKGIEPVAIALEEIEVSGDVRFTGLDLDSGSKVVVTIERSGKLADLHGQTRDVSGLVLMLTLQRIPAGC